METNFERFCPLSESDLEKIHSKTVDILTNTGMRVESESARKIFHDHGLRVDGQTVYFTESAINEAVEKAPQCFTIIARNPRHNLEVGGDKFAFGPSGISPFFMEPSGVQRAATKADCIDYLKLAQSCDLIAFNRQAVLASDVPQEDNHFWHLLAEIKYTDKPCQIYDENSLRLACMAFGITPQRMKEDAQKGIHYALGGINPVSPLFLTADQSDRLLLLAEHGIPVVVAAMPAAGMSAPCTLPGLLIAQNCENLGTIVLSQLSRPGAPVIYGAIGTVTHMKTGGAPIGAPETRIIERASAQIARYYRLPSRGDCGLTDSLDTDFQAGAESALQFYNTVNSGLNLLPGIGELGSWLHASLEKFVLDCEIAGYVQRMCRPLEFTEENMAADLIKKVGTAGSYISEMHTFKHFRDEFYEPSVFQRTVYDRWEQEGRIDLKERARKKARELLENYEKPDIDPQLEKDLEKFVERRLGD
jgi:trimethylamine--corrinoid protein Co-methyltransferase